MIFGRILRNLEICILISCQFSTVSPCFESDPSQAPAGQKALAPIPKIPPQNPEFTRIKIRETWFPFFQNLSIVKLLVLKGGACGALAGHQKKLEEGNAFS